MSDLIEAASSSRSRCRQCRQPIAQGELRFGSDESGFYGDSDSYAWFHLRCATQRMPDRALVVLRKVARPASVPGYAELVAACEKAKKKSDSKYPYGERAPTGRARCMRCNEPIAQGSFRVAVEREIQAGAFVQTGAGYLHPACAVAELAIPDLASVVAANSAILSAADKKELVAVFGATAGAPAPAVGDAAPPGASTRKVAVRVTQEKARPSAETGEELVFADALIEKADPRGELIVLESQRASLDWNDPRQPELAARAKALAKPARVAWAKAIGLKERDFTLARGLPSGVKVATRGNKVTIPSHPWIRGVRILARSGAAIAALVADPGFARMRHLAIEGGLGWQTLRDLCATGAVTQLRSLDVQLGLGARGLHLLLTAKRFASLERLVVTTNWQPTPDLRGYESVAGLPAIRSIVFGRGVTREMMAKLVLSPLFQRVEEVSVIAWSWPDETPPLPNLRRLTFHEGSLSAKAARGLAAVAAKMPLLRIELGTSDDAAAQRALEAGFGDRVRGVTKVVAKEAVGKATVEASTRAAAKKAFAKAGGKKAVAKKLAAPERKTRATGTKPRPTKAASKNAAGKTGGGKKPTGKTARTKR